MNNMDNPSAFTQEQVVSEPTEIEKIQNRVASFEVGLKPAVAEAVQGVIGIGLSKGLFGVDDLEAVISIREDIKKGLISYQTTIKHAQMDMETAQQNLMIQQAEEVELEKNRQRTKLTEERQLRKSADARLAQMEQALANQGLFIDLDGDGVVGLKDGQVADTLTASEQAEVTSMLTPPVQTQPDPNHKTSGAFKLARMMNPVGEMDAGSNGTTAEDLTPAPTSYNTPEPISHDEKFVAQIDAATEAFKNYDENVVGGEDTESFLDEVATVDALADIDDQEVMDAIDEEQFNESFAEPTLDIGYAPTEISRREKVLLDPLGASERSDTINAEIPKPQQVTAPFITGGNAPNLTQPQVTTTPLADGVYVEHTESEIMQDELEPIPTEESELPHHRRPQIQETRTESVLAKPVVSGGNFKPRAESVSTGQSIEAPLSDAAKFQQNVDDAKQSFAEWADDNSDTVTEVESTAKVIPTYDSEEELLAAAQAKIDQKVQDDIDEDQFNESYEEETEEVTIPDRTDLEAMSKVQILEAAEMFEFDIPATISKGQMIDKFESETEAFIARLQDSGEFVSAEEDTNDNNDVRDGGYF